MGVRKSDVISIDDLSEVEKTFMSRRRTLVCPRKVYFTLRLILS